MGQYIWPCQPAGRVSSGFGPRKAPKPGASTFHNGIDISAPSGTAIIAARPGKVVTAAYNNARGKYIIIDHGGGVSTLYQHASKLLVSVGASVSAGQKIALVGSTGISTGNHLHFEIRINGQAKNPLNYVGAKNTASNYAGPKGISSNPPSGGGSSSKGRQASAGSAAMSTPETPQKKEIKTVVVKSISGTGTAQKEQLTGLEPYLKNGVEILIQNDQVYFPCVEGDVVLERSRKGAPSKLTFTVMADETLNFQEGNPVTFRFNGQPVFFGFVFAKSRKDMVTIDVTCYDQIRYLKNKDTISYSNKTYSELLKMLADDYHLKCGTVEDTKFKIDHRIEEGTLLDILENASDLTVANTGQLFVLYDDFGKLALQNIQNMKLPIVIDSDTAQSFDYQSGIDKDTYNRVKMAVDNDTTGEREVHILNDATNQAAWGVLQYYEKLDSGVDPATLKAKAQTMLAFYNKKRRSLRISKCFGDIRVRGGSLLVIKLGLGDINVQNYMCVESVNHTFSHGIHTMDLVLSGIKGEFIA